VIGVSVGVILLYSVIEIGYMAINECTGMPCYPYKKEAQEQGQKEFDALCKKENLDCSDVGVFYTLIDDGCWFITYYRDKHQSYKEIGYHVCPHEEITLPEPEEIKNWPREEEKPLK